jgi:hypothetical protein
MTVRPRIIDNPTCDKQTMHEAFHVLQEQILFHSPTYVRLIGLYGQATTNWVNNGGDPYVDVNPSDGLHTGATVDTSNTHRVRLPKNVGPTPGCPNILEGEILPYWAGEDGLYFTTYGSDCPIGTVKMWARSTAYPDGWGIMDGTGNSEGNGGTGINLSSHFVKAGTDSNVGDEGGSATHDHDITVASNTTGISGAVASAAIVATFTASVAAAAIVGTIENHTCQQVVDCILDHDLEDLAAAITVDDHPSQDLVDALVITVDAHDSLATEFVDNDGGGSTVEVLAAVESLGHNVQFSGQQDVTHSVSASQADPLTHEAEQGDGLAHNAVAAASAAVTLTAGVGASAAVSITDSGHGHTGVSDEVSNDPLFCYLIFIERLDNSADFTP